MPAAINDVSINVIPKTGRLIFFTLKIMEYTPMKKDAIGSSIYMAFKQNISNLTI